jgi:DNA-binding XRE family transcriptional regulator
LRKAKEEYEKEQAEHGAWVKLLGVIAGRVGGSVSEAERSRGGRPGSDQKTEVAARFAENLRRIRLIERLSQEAMAQRASLHRTQIGLLESGNRVCRIDTLIRRTHRGDHLGPSPETKGAFTFNSRPFSRRTS